MIIDGVVFNKCDGCPLYDGNMCTGARLDEETSEKDTNICNEHLAEQFWVVRRQLQLKQQECDNYKQALDEIEKTIDNGTANTQANNAKWLHEYYLARYCEIREIIDEVKE